MKRLSLLIMACLLASCGDSSPSDTTMPAAEMTPVERGAILYKRCRTCHTLGQGERHKVGPNLHGVFGAEAGTKDGFVYSNAMKESDIIWTDETLSTYLERPSDYIPGNRMSFAGLRHLEDREAVIAYLRQETTAP